ncbi:MAG: hypothetical protein GY909_10195 [Oligoflexia bacterium]|nr:hypothetical protein [Oligoflexia bacterium]
MKYIIILLLALTFSCQKEDEKEFQYSNSLTGLKAKKEVSKQDKAAAKLDKVLAGEDDESCDTEEETKAKLLEKMKKASENNEAVSLQGSDTGCSVD